MFLRIYQKQLFILEDVKWSFVLRKPKHFCSNYMNKARILMNESVEFTEHLGTYPRYKSPKRNLHIFVHTHHLRIIFYSVLRPKKRNLWKGMDNLFRHQWTIHQIKIKCPQIVFTLYLSLPVVPLLLINFYFKQKSKILGGYNST